jgi:hypothetical protein
MNGYNAITTVGIEQLMAAKNGNTTLGVVPAGSVINTVL